jgi:hypothetical protein
MDNLTIPQTKFSLRVDFDVVNGRYEMTGSSYPENALEFFDPIFRWIERFAEERPGPMVLELRLEYLNTSSSKCILDLFKMLEDFARSGGEIRVHWHYDEDDEDMMETGEEFLEDLELPFELIANQ